MAPTDAEVVTRLRAAGAGITATLNMAEFALGVTSQNSAHGGVVNPWDPGPHPGRVERRLGAAVAGTVRRCVRVPDFVIASADPPDEAPRLDALG